MFGFVAHLTAYAPWVIDLLFRTPRMPILAKPIGKVKRVEAFSPVNKPTDPVPQLMNLVKLHLQASSSHQERNFAAEFFMFRSRLQSSLATYSVRSSPLTAPSSPPTPGIKVVSIFACPVPELEDESTSYSSTLRYIILSFRFLVKTRLRERRMVSGVFS
jgi:hypothetical protein